MGGREGWRFGKRRPDCRFYGAAIDQPHGAMLKCVGSTYTPPFDTVLGRSGPFVDGVSGSSIVGCYYDGDIDKMYGFVYDGSTVTTLNVPGAVPGRDCGTCVSGVSGNTVTGTYQDSAKKSHGFVYDGSTYTILDHPEASSLGTFATDISGGKIIGGYYTPSGESCGFVYDGSSYTTLPGQSDYAYRTLCGISGDMIVGYYYTAGAFAHGLVYNGSSYTTLDCPLGVKGTVLTDIDGTNIVGYYYDSSNNKHGFLATAVPEPSVWCLLITATAALLGYNGRRKTNQEARERT